MDGTYLLMWEAQQIIRMHQPTAVVQTERDPHARWRDVVLAKRDGEPTTYRRGQCDRCGADGCALLDAAQAFHAVVSPYLAAEVHDDPTGRPTGPQVPPPIPSTSLFTLPPTEPATRTVHAGRSGRPEFMVPATEQRR